MQNNRKTLPDANLYDAPESDQYVQGYVLAMSVTMSSRVFLDVQLLVHDKKLNPYAFIPTDIPTSDKENGVLCYVAFATEFEYRIAKYCINMKERGYNIHTTEPDIQPVWFHKSWILKDYDPTMYDTGEKKYNRVKNPFQISQLFPPRDILEWRRDQCRKKKCYAPISDQNENCKNSCKGLVNKKICYFCAASKSGRNCVDASGHLRLEDE